MRPAAIELHIEEVVLRGLAGIDRDAVWVALEVALTGLLRDSTAVAWASVDRASADGGRVDVGADASTFGAGLAEALFATVSGADLADLGGRA